MDEHRDNSNRLVIDFHEIEEGKYSKITAAVVAEFGLDVAGAKTVGLDEVFQDFKREADVVSLEWDNWSGYIVNAKTESAEPLVRDIADFISAKFNS